MFWQIWKISQNVCRKKNCFLLTHSMVLQPKLSSTYEKKAGWVNDDDLTFWEFPMRMSSRAPFLHIYTSMSSIGRHQGASLSLKKANNLCCCQLYCYWDILCALNSRIDSLTHTHSIDTLTHAHIPRHQRRFNTIFYLTTILLFITFSSNAIWSWRANENMHNIIHDSWSI